MSLNLEAQIFHSEDSTSFHSKIKHGYDIAQRFTRLIKPYIQTPSENIIQTFSPLCGVIKKGTLYIGDEGGYVTEVSENHTFSIIYQHDRRVNALIDRSQTSQIISCSSDEKILLYDLDSTHDPITLLSTEEIFHICLNE